MAVVLDTGVTKPTDPTSALDDSGTMSEGPALDVICVVEAAARLTDGLDISLV